MQGKLFRAPSVLTLACRRGACGAFAAAGICGYFPLRERMLAIMALRRFAASYGIIRRCAAIVPRRAIVLVARRISFFLHSLSEQTQGYDVSCTTHERLHASVSRTLPAISATSGNAGGSQHPHGRTGTWRGGRGLRCVFLCILSHTYTRVDYFGASKFLRASTACVAL